jgi:hypothetical protein
VQCKKASSILTIEKTAYSKLVEKLQEMDHTATKNTILILSTYTVPREES